MASASTTPSAEFVVPEGFVVPAPSWTLFRRLPKFDLRNGDASSITSVLIKATVPQAFHWVPVGLLNSEDAVTAVDGYIRSHLAHLNEHKPAGMSAAVVRKVGIVLGTIRAVATTFYRLDTTDLIPGEHRAPILNGRLTTDGTVEYAPTEAYIPEVHAAVTDPLAFSDAEAAAICALVKCAAGVIPMQGYSLMMTSHHYLSVAESQSRKVYAVVEKAYWKSVDVATWFTDDLAAIQDAAWHKATHPVHMHIKNSTAMDPDIAVKLSAAGSGACASRLPAMESDLRAASSYVTLYSTVAPMFKMFGGDVDITVLNDHIKLVKGLPPGVENPVIPSGLPIIEGVVVTNRHTALNALSALLKRNADSAAYCYGFYTALSDTSMSLGGAGGTVQDTLKTSFSLSKLRTQSYASYVAGTQSFGDYQAVRNLKRQNGEYLPPVFVIL